MKTNFAERKLVNSIRLARQCSRDTWREPVEDRKEYAALKKEAMQDARYWRGQLQA